MWHGIIVAREVEQIGSSRLPPNPFEVGQWLRFSVCGVAVLAHTLALLRRLVQISTDLHSFLARTLLTLLNVDERIFSRCYKNPHIHSLAACCVSERASAGGSTTTVVAVPEC